MDVIISAMDTGMRSSDIRLVPVASNAWRKYIECNRGGYFRLFDYGCRTEYAQFTLDVLRRKRRSLLLQNHPDKQRHCGTVTDDAGDMIEKVNAGFAALKTLFESMDTLSSLLRQKEAENMATQEATPSVSVEEPPSVAPTRAPKTPKVPKPPIVKDKDLRAAVVHVLRHVVEFDKGLVPDQSIHKDPALVRKFRSKAKRIHVVKLTLEALCSHGYCMAVASMPNTYCATFKARVKCRRKNDKEYERLLSSLSFAHEQS